VFKQGRFEEAAPRLKQDFMDQYTKKGNEMSAADNFCIPHRSTFVCYHNITEKRHTLGEKVSLK
jgi:hypothetical protein